ncbi:MAG: hypothetical protein A3B68_05160 [Candidatus Melainabacteria bacterium RIFCSPHIGHO2_02_FULL_34_12]|nr:MAG: hypothetical protein A3B68_05160 [Candidatus Melainabacteria bacterium RIFCSPHIGHO2_02_FULL_34_12]
MIRLHKDSGVLPVTPPYHIWQRNSTRIKHLLNVINDEGDEIIQLMRKNVSMVKGSNIMCGPFKISEVSPYKLITKFGISGSDPEIVFCLFKDNWEAFSPNEIAAFSDAQFFLVDRNANKITNPKTFEICRNGDRNYAEVSLKVSECSEVNTEACSMTESSNDSTGAKSSVFNLGLVVNDKTISHFGLVKVISWTIKRLTHAAVV